jgi:hypothetical protein
MITARQINTFIKAAHAIGKYVYAHTAETIVTGNMPRIIAAKTISGEVRVKVLSNGKWQQLTNDTLVAK